jgi:hypothetical protein
MRHRNKAHRPAIAPGHRRICDFSSSYRVVYGPDGGLPSATDATELTKAALTRVEQRWRSIVGDDWPRLQESFADIAIGAH